MSNVLTFPFGPLNGALSSIGEELNELAGVRLTRTTAAASAGDSLIFVETNFGWSPSGTLYVDGRRYTYSGVTTSPDSFTGLQEIRDGVATASPGLAEDLRELTTVADGNENFSGIEDAKRMLFVDTAEADFLDVIGRNYGLTRPSSFIDADYRDFIRTVAFLSRGTVYSIERVLTELVGAGNFTVFEDLVNFPNCVFISLAGALSPDPNGAAYFNQREEATSTTTTTVSITGDPIGGARSVIGVFLAPDSHTSDMNQLPSADPTTAWSYGGAAVEGTAVTVNTDGTILMDDSSAVTDGPYYSRTLIADPLTDVYVGWVLANPTSTADDACVLVVEDGSASYGVGWDATDVFLYDLAGAARVGAAVAHNGASPASYRLERLGSEGVVRLYQDGVLISEEPTSSFSATASQRIAFGSFSAAGTGSATWHDLRALAVDDTTNYFNAIGSGTVASADPDRVVSAAVDGTEVGRIVRVYGGTVNNGLANGNYEIVAAVAATNFDVQGVSHTATADSEPLTAVNAEDVRIARSWDEFSVEDVGIKATLTIGAGSAGVVYTSRHGAADADQITVQIIHAVPATVQVAVVDDGDGPEDIEITLNPALHTAADVVAAIAAASDASNLVSAALVGDGTGTPPVTAATNLSGGSDGKILVITGSALGNDGSYNLAALTDSRNALLGTHRSPPGLTAESDLDWRKDPNFPNDSVSVEIAAAGTWSNPTLTLRQTLPQANTPVIAVYTTVLSAHALREEFVTNDPVGTYYPFYLADPFAFVREFVDDVTVAGVIAKYQE